MATSNAYSPMQAFRAGEDLTQKQDHFVKLDANSNLVLAGAGERAFPLVDDPNVGEYGTIQVTLRARIVAGGPIDPMDQVTSDGEGRAIKAAAGTEVNGIALGKATAAGQIVPILVVPGGSIPATP